MEVDRSAPPAELLDLPAGLGSPDGPLNGENVHGERRLAATSNEKYAGYGSANDASAHRQVLCLRPQRVIAGTSFPGDAPRSLCRAAA
jgi:hypothetical protein